MRLTITLSVSSLAVGLLLAGCSDASTTPDGGAGADGQAQVNEVSAAVLDDADESLASVLDQIGGGTMALNDAPCPAIAGSFTNDPAPSFTATVTFGTLPELTTPWPPAADDPCLRTGEPGWGDRDLPGGMSGGDAVMKVYLFGRLQKTVTGTSDADFERSEAVTDLGWVRTASDFTDYVRMQRNGTRGFTRSATGLRAREDMVTARERKLRGRDLQSTITGSLEWSFVPVDGATLVSRASRPSGYITVTGTHHFDGDVPVRTATDDTISIATVDVTHAVSTTVPLFYDSSCTSVPPRRRIASGQLLFTRTGGASARSFTVTWKGCGTEPVRAEVP